MKQFTVLCLLVLFAFPALSQEVAEEDTLDLPRKYGFWVAAYMEPAYIPHAFGPNVAVGAAFVYNEQWYLGAFGSYFVGDYKERIIFPASYRLFYGQTGLWMGYKSRFKEKNFQLTTDIRLGEGPVIWEKQDNFADTYKDYVLFIQPSVGIDVKFLTYLAGHAGVGYRLAEGVNNMPQLSNARLSSITFNLMLKVGLF